MSLPGYNDDLYNTYKNQHDKRASNVSSEHGVSYTAKLKISDTNINKEVLRKKGHKWYW